MKFILLILLIKSINCSEVPELCADDKGIINSINKRCECISLKLWISSVLQLIFMLIGGGYWYNGWGALAVITTLLTLISSIITIILGICCFNTENEDELIFIISIYKIVLGVIMLTGTIGLIIILSNE